MKLFGYLMILTVIQLFVLGSQIQRGRASWIPAGFLKQIREEHLSMYCRKFGNHLLTLAIIAGICAWLSLTAASVSLTPVLLFGAGIVLVMVLILMDTKRYSSDRA
ncbi:MAG: hypothetical protein PUE84_06360 [Firmicutes bacterium]|nr:hypothetical protein [Bacillota bacterium]